MIFPTKRKDLQPHSRIMFITEYLHTIFDADTKVLPSTSHLFLKISTCFEAPILFLKKFTKDKFCPDKLSVIVQTIFHSIIP
jgi:hypothetical protein